jgi:RNA polymerase sigma-70 factor (ECF subfamily)
MSNDSHPISDQVLITNILNGKYQDFAIVVKNTEKLVTQIVRKMVVNQDDQRDLVQEIYIKAYLNLSTFQFKSKLSTWVANIAYNTSVNFLQKMKVPISDIESSMEFNIKSSENTEMEIIKNEVTEILSKEINKLAPVYKTLITLYHIEELSNKEISDITHLPEGTIKSYLSRARKILKDNINHHFNNN